MPKQRGSLLCIAALLGAGATIAAGPALAKQTSASFRAWAVNWRAPQCEGRLREFLVSLKLGQHASAICGSGYTMLDDVLHLSQEQCVSHNRVCACC